MRSQGKRTRASLLDAGMHVLTERGLHAVRVDDVVRVAKVSHGTFYLYFANKEDLFRALAVQCSDAMSELAGSLGPIADDEGGLEELRRWIGEFLALYRTYGVVIRAWMEDQLADRELARLGTKAFEAFLAALVTRVSQARPDDTHAAQLRGAALLAMIERYTYFLTSRNLDIDDADSIDTLAVLIHRGVFA